MVFMGLKYSCQQQMCKAEFIRQLYARNRGPVSKWVPDGVRTIFFEDFIVRWTRECCYMSETGG